MLDRTYESNEEMSASQIYLDGPQPITSITNCEFLDNSGLKIYFPKLVPNNQLSTGSYPRQYFTFSMSPLININIPEVAKTQQNIIYFYKCKFAKNYNTQIVTFPDLFDNPYIYKGSLIQVLNPFNKDLKKFQISITITECQGNDNFIQGFSGSQIYLQNAQVIFSFNIFKNSGYMMGDSMLRNNVIVHNYQQEFGILYIDNKDASEMNIDGANAFFNNQFEFIFANQGSAYTIEAPQHSLIFSNNIYSYLFASYQGAVLLNLDATPSQIIILSNETFSNAYSIKRGALTFQRGSSYNPMQVKDFISIVNSKFNNCRSLSGGVINIDKATRILLENINFTMDAGTLSSPDQILKSYITIVQPIFAYMYYLEMLRIIQNNIYSSDGQIFITGNSENQIYEQVLNKITATNLTQSTMNTLLYSSNIRLALSNITITNSNVQQSAMLNFDINSFVQIDTLNITQCISQTRASAINVGSQSNVTIINGQFNNNQATELATIIVQAKGIFTCQYCRFVNNYAFDTSTIIGYQEAQIILISSQFVQNRGGFNLISAIYARLRISNTTFIDNVMTKINNGISLYASEAFLEQVTVNYTGAVKQNGDIENGFIILNSVSKIEIHESKFSNIQASKNVFLQASGSSTITLSTTILENLNAQNGTIIQASLAQFLVLKQMTFRNNRVGNEIFSDKTTSTILESIFQNGTGRYIKAIGSTMEITSCQFLNGSTLITQGGKGIWSINQINLSITKSVFKGLSSKINGGALIAETSEIVANSLLFLQQNEFSDNNSTTGGAVALQNIRSASLFTNKFLRNSADSGGALYTSCSYRDITEPLCILDLKISNIFTSNKANVQSGAIQQNNYIAKEDSSNIYSLNVAPYSPNVGSYPQRIHVEFLENGDYVNPYSKISLLQSEGVGLISLRNNEPYQIDLPIFASGKPFSFLVYVLDQQGFLYSINILSASATLKYSQNQSVSITNNKVSYEKGIFNFTNVIIYTSPNSTPEFLLEIKNIDTYGNPNEGIDIPILLSLNFRSCVKGEELTPEMRCSSCLEGTYLYEAPNGGETKCLPCYDNAKCFGGLAVAPKPGYWRENNKSEIFISCLNPQACKVGNSSDLVGKCQDGYQGYACTQCQIGYFMKDNFECDICPESSILNARLAVGIVVAFLIFTIIIQQSLKQSKVTPYLRMITNHFQILYPISLIAYNWPSQIDNFHEGHSNVSRSPMNIFYLDCMIQKEGGLPTVMQKMIGYTVLPIVLAVFGYFLVFLIIRKFSFKEIAPRLISAIVILWYFAHPIVTQGILEIFDCILIQGELRMKTDTHTYCYEGQHGLFVYIFAIPSLIVWSIGIPLYNYILLKRNTSVNLKNQIKTSYLSIGYKSQNWEVILMYRKLLIIASAQLLPSVELQLLVTLGLVTLFLCLHLKYKPHQCSRLNRLDLLSQIVPWITLYIGLLYNRQGDSEMNAIGVQWLMFSLMIGCHALFYGYWLWHVRIEILKSLNCNDELFSILACMSKQRFQEKYMKQQKHKIVEEESSQRVALKSIPKQISPRKKEILPEYQEEDEYEYQEEVIEIENDDYNDEIQHDFSPQLPQPIQVEDQSVLMKTRPKKNNQNKVSNIIQSVKNSKTSDKVYPSDSIEGSLDSHRRYKFKNQLDHSHDRLVNNDHGPELIIPNHIDIPDIYSSSDNDEKQQQKQETVIKKDLEFNAYHREQTVMPVKKAMNLPPIHQARAFTDFQVVDPNQNELPPTEPSEIAKTISKKGKKKKKKAKKTNIEAPPVQLQQQKIDYISPKSAPISNQRNVPAVVKKDETDSFDKLYDDF